MWDENTLKQCMENKLDLVFGQKVLLLDLDTVNTGAGRPDVVLLNENSQLIIVEWESLLTTGNIGHALLDQAWDYAKHYWCEILPSDIPELRRRYWDYRFPGRPIPDLHTELGLESDAEIWDRGKPCIVVVGAWDVREPVYQAAQRLMQETYAGERRKMPCEVWVYDIHGSQTARGNIVITDCKRTLVFQADGHMESHSDGCGLRISNQHASARLTDEFVEVKLKMSDYVSDELKQFMEMFHSKDRWKRQLLKWSPWGTEKEICFEFGRMDSQNLIKGPCFQLRIGGRKQLGYRLRYRLNAALSGLADELGCSEDDLKSQGYTYPIKQHRVDDSNPEAIARGFARFCSVIYHRVDGLIREELGQQQ